MSERKPGGVSSIHGSRKQNTQREPIRDPEVTVGPYRLLQRSDGYWIAYDAARPLSERSAYTHKDRDNVVRWMHANVAP